MKIKFLAKLSFLFSTLLLCTLAFANDTHTVKIEVVKLEQPITLGTLETLNRIIAHAQAQKSEAILIELDTPGGFLEATRDIVKLLLNTDSPRVIVWVTPEGARAASAGSMITMAAHFAVMSPNTSIGAATPISGDGKEIPSALKSKVENDTISFVKGIAHKRNRNEEWAVRSVTEAASTTAEDAAKNKIIDLVAGNREQIWQAYAQKFQLNTEAAVQYIEHELSIREKVLNFLSNPNISYGLFALGGLGIYLEMTNPGTFIPGTLGVISLALGAITMKIIPIQPGAIGLLLIGIILLGIEFLTVIPTFGVAGVGGVVSLILSGVFLIDSSQSDLGLNGGIWIPIGLTLIGFGVWLGYLTSRSLIANKNDQTTQGLVGQLATVESHIEKGFYWVRVHGELWKANFSHATVELKKDQTVKIVSQNGLELGVEIVS